MRYVPIPIDPRLTVDCDEPQLMGDTNRDVGVYAVEANASIKECNIRLQKIREVTQE